MKKLFIKKIAAVGILGITAIACDLDTVNKAVLPPDVALADSTGFKATVFSAYERVNDFAYYGQVQIIQPEVMADNMVIVNNTGRFVQQSVNAVGSHMNRWGTDDGLTTLPTGRYVPINECNFVINKIDELATVTEAQKNRLKGEAYFLRALNYFDLLRIYGYEPGREVNGFNLGVILRTEPVEKASDADLRERATNVEGYQLVEADLLQAINLLPVPAPVANTVTSYPYRATKQAAHALLSKVYLYWGKYGDASTQADLALGFSNGPLTTTANFIASWSATPHPESFFESQIPVADWSSVDGANESLHSVTMNLLAGSQYVVAASDELIAAHEAGDIRRNLYDNVPGAGPAGTQGKYRCKKWPGGGGGSFVENIPIIRRADVMLISAEGKARSNDENGARTMLNALRAARGLAAASDSGQALLDLLLNERRVELAFEGNRWFDLKRLGKDITKPAALNVPILPYSDFRVLSRIPVDQVVLNPHLRQNPGY